jgi:hypothetical protein
MSSSTRLVRGVIRSFAEGILGRLAAAVDVETDFRLGILEGEGCDKEGMGAVIAVFVDERRRLGGIVVEKRSVVVDAFGISTHPRVALAGICGIVVFQAKVASSPRRNFGNCSIFADPIRNSSQPDIPNIPSCTQQHIPIAVICNHEILFCFKEYNVPEAWKHPSLSDIHSVSRVE